MPHLWPLFRNARLVHWGGRVELAERAHVDVHRLAPGGARGVRAPPEAVNEEARRHPRVAHVLTSRQVVCGHLKPGVTQTRFLVVLNRPPRGPI